MIRGQPREPLVKAIPGRGARRLDVPIPVTNPRQPELLLDLVGLHRWKGEEGGKLRENGVVSSFPIRRREFKIEKSAS